MYLRKEAAELTRRPLPEDPILMIVGAVGLIISLFWMAVWRDRRAAGARYVERDVPAGYAEREVPPASGY